MESSRRTLSFASISGRKVEADFDGGTTTSDAGALLRRQAESNIGIIDRVVAAMSDRRHPSYVDHTYTDLIRQRVFQIACGYEDANDSNDLRSDPGFKAACGRLPLSGADLASQPTMSRLENSVSRTDLYRIGLALLEGFIESYDQPPKKIILDIDDTDDITHGAQQLSLFNAYHDEYCYMPVHLYEGTTGKLITTILRPGCRMRGAQAAAILKRVLDPFLHSDRTSCHRFAANQFRLFLHSVAYVLLHAIKHRGLRGTQWARANFDTIQLRFLKIGARVREQATKVRFHLPTSYPLKDLLRTIVRNLDTT